MGENTSQENKCKCGKGKIFPTAMTLEEKIPASVPPTYSLKIRWACTNPDCEFTSSSVINRPTAEQVKTARRFNAQEST